jgi:hypothetical protein
MFHNGMSKSRVANGNVVTTPKGIVQSVRPRILLSQYPWAGRFENKKRVKTLK